MMTEEYLTQSWRCDCGTLVAPDQGGVCVCGLLHPEHPLNEEDAYDDFREENEW